MDWIDKLTTIHPVRVTYILKPSQYVGLGKWKFEHDGITSIGNSNAMGMYYIGVDDARKKIELVDKRQIKDIIVDPHFPEKVKQSNIVVKVLSKISIFKQTYI